MVIHLNLHKSEKTALQPPTMMLLEHEQEHVLPDQGCALEYESVMLTKMQKDCPSSDSQNNAVRVSSQEPVKEV